MSLLVEDVIQVMETWVPLSLAESWDNPGLMVGDRRETVTGILTTLDVTEEAVSYAINHNINMIISHHPLIFKGLKHIDKTSPIGKLLYSLIQSNIAVYSAHTNLDIAKDGLNDMLAGKLGLKDSLGFVKTGSSPLYKLVVYAPTSHSDSVRRALDIAGAGSMGNYAGCSYSSVGEGRFTPIQGAHPFIGQLGQMEVVEEERIETLVQGKILSNVIQAMLKAHPYEEVAYDVFPLKEPQEVHYLGRLGDLKISMNYKEFIQYVQHVLPKARVRAGGAKKEVIQRIAICSGSGAEFIAQAATRGADAYITGDVKYHDMQLAKELGILVIDAGHFGTEECVATGIASYISPSIHEIDPTISIMPYEEQQDFFFLTN